MSRKKELSRRSFAYAQQGDPSADPIVNTRAYAFQDGYRAAMRDARRASKEDMKHPGARHWFPRLCAFLRPLR